MFFRAYNCIKNKITRSFFIVRLLIFRPKSMGHYQSNKNFIQGDVIKYGKP